MGSRVKCRSTLDVLLDASLTLESQEKPSQEPPLHRQIPSSSITAIAPFRFRIAMFAETDTLVNETATQRGT